MTRIFSMLTASADLEAERDEWRARAEAAQGELARLRAPLQVTPRRRRSMRLPAATWLLIIGVLVGGAAIPRAQDRPILTDYAGCIGAARYEHPLEDDHQELVNALYECGVYELADG